MKPNFSSKFTKSYDQAPLNIRKASDKQLRLLLVDLRHPSLHAKKYDEVYEMWQARVIFIFRNEVLHYKYKNMSLSTIVNAFLRNFIKTETFSVSAAEEMTPYMESWVAEIEKDKMTGKNTNGPFDSIEELKSHLSR